MQHAGAAMLLRGPTHARARLPPAHCAALAARTQPARAQLARPRRREHRHLARTAAVAMAFAAVLAAAALTATVAAGNDHATVTTTTTAEVGDAAAAAATAADAGAASPPLAAIGVDDVGTWSPEDGLSRIGDSGAELWSTGTATEDHPAFRDAPVMLLNAVDQNTQLSVMDEGVAFLEALGDTKLAIVVTAGPARSGKSFLLNNLLGVPQDGGFRIGHRPTAETKGIWFWGRPRRVRIGGEDVALVLMDTEGFGALGNVGSSYDPKLCAFAVIFASSFYYNLQGQISMENLLLLKDVAKFDEVFRQQFDIEFPLAPPFWIVQSFEFELSGFDPPTAEGYLDFAYQRKVLREGGDAAGAGAGNAGAGAGAGDSGESAEVRRYNDVIEMIARKFPEQARPRIMVMHHPREGTRKTRLTDLAWGDYDAEYREQVLELRRIVARRVSVKSFSNFQVTGNSMATLTRKMIPKLNKLNSDASDLIRDIATVVATECFQGYLSDVDAARLPAPARLVETVHEAAEADAFARFDDGVMVRRSDLPEYHEPRDALGRNMSAEHRHRLMKNEVVAGAHCEEMLHARLEDLKRMLTPGSAEGAAAAEAAGGGTAGLEAALESRVAEALALFDETCHMPEAVKASKRTGFTDSVALLRERLEYIASQELSQDATKWMFSFVLALGALWVANALGLLPAWLAEAARLGFAAWMAAAGLMLSHHLGYLGDALRTAGVQVTDAEIGRYGSQAAAVARRVGWLFGGVRARMAGAAVAFGVGRDALLHVAAPDAPADLRRQMSLAVDGTAVVVVASALYSTRRNRKARLGVLAVLAATVVAADLLHTQLM